MTALLPAAEVADHGIDTDFYLEINEEALTEDYLIEGLRAASFDHHMWTRPLARRPDLTDKGIAAIRSVRTDSLTEEILRDRGLADRNTRETA